MPRGSLSLFNFNAWLQSPEIVSILYDFMDLIILAIRSDSVHLILSIALLKRWGKLKHEFSHLKNEKMGV